jgi:hypothetical protein
MVTAASDRSAAAAVPEREAGVSERELLSMAKRACGPVILPGAER